MTLVGVDIENSHVLVPPEGGVAAASVRGGFQILMDREMRSHVKVDAIWG